MDGSSDSGVVEAPLLERVIEAVNAQAVQQISNLAHGPLAVGVAQALAAAIEHHQSVTATVLQGSVLFEGKLYGLTIQIAAHP